MHVKDIDGGSKSHVCVCIPTHKRVPMLRGLLTSLQSQRTEQRFSYSILVVDNDKDESARGLVSEMAPTAVVPIRYCVAPEKGVAVARNYAVRNAVGDLIAFIDDDELPGDAWLMTLLAALERYGVAGVLGPVKPTFDPLPPSWILEARIFDRPSYPTGTVLHWDLTRTGNVLLRRALFDDPDNLFNPAFIHGEDKDFFKRLIEKGFVFVWCDEAPVYEKETPDRFTRTYFIKRALLRGSVAVKHRGFSGRAVAKAMIAIVVYSALLPFLCLRGHHVFMTYVIKLCDHLGAIMAACGVNVARYSSGV